MLRGFLFYLQLQPKLNDTINSSNMFKPDFLKAGDRIRIVSPAGWVKEEKVLPAVELLRNEGFEVVLGDHVFSRHFQFAGADQERLSDIQLAFDDPQCKAVICSRGGYGSVRIAGDINFSFFRDHPKWLVGFSDITLLHARLQKEGFCSIHGAMPAFYLNDDQPSQSFSALMKVLKGDVPSNTLSPQQFNRHGSATGMLTGGNLSIVYSLIGTPMEQDTDGHILFIEDISEYLYHLDRMMHSLKFSGKLSKLKGLLVGGFTEVRDNESPFGQNVEEIVMQVAGEYNYPICFGFPAGHLDVNLPVVLGATYRLEVDEKQASFSMVP